MGKYKFLKEKGDGLVLEVHVQPKAARNEVAGTYLDFLKLRLTAPPVEGQANKECLKYLSELLKVPKSHMEVIQGARSRQKSILIHWARLESVEAILEEILVG
jgi:uncharacterized protein